MTPEMFWSNAKKLIGTPYSQCDCIGVVRKSLGISCQGTNWLWRSITNSSKYRYLQYRSVDMAGIEDGAVVFRVRWQSIPSGYGDTPDAHHVGVYYKGRVIQSNPKPGVYEDDFHPDSWSAWGKMKQVEYVPTVDPPEESTAPDGPQLLSDHEMIMAIYNAICGGRD